MAAKKVEELKSAGNQYITSKPPQYEKAIEAYTEALSVDPDHHAILSNRSLAYYKLARYEDALADAEKAVQASPKWAKGFLRKCAALNALKRNAEAKTVAEIGFQLMHSTSFCREFVSQWLEACESLYSVEKLPSLLPYGEADLCQVMIIHWLGFREESNVGKDVGFLPDSLVILSEQYWKVFFRCLASRTSPVLSVYTHDLMQQHLNSIAEDFEKIAGLFGQRVGTVVKDWVEAIATQVDHAVLVQLSARASEKSSHLVSFLDSDFHPTLYPLARSLLALAVTVVATRVYVLNSSSTGFDSVSYMLQACLWLFERSILSTKEYTGLHLKVLTGLVDSYNRRYKPISHLECAQLAKYCKSIESLLPVYATSCALEYQQMSEAYQQIVATAKGLILARQTGTAIPFQGLSDEPQEMSIASALRDVEKYPAQVKSFATDHLQEIVNKPPSMLSISDGQDLLQLTGVFLKLDDLKSAKKALSTGEVMLLSVIGVQLQLGTLMLEEAPSTIGALRQDVLMNAMLLKDLDARVVTDMMIRWKSLFSEFRTITIREGLGNVYFSTATTLHSLQISGTSMKNDSSGDIALNITQEHKRKEIEFMEEHAFRCWSAVVECPRLLPVEKVLEPDELVVEFVHVGKYDEAKLRAFLQLCILAITPNGERELVSIDSTECNHLVKEWLEQWNAYTSEGSSPEAVRNLQEAGKRLSTVLFPSTIQKRIKHPAVKHVYLCLELFGTMPVHLLPDEDGFLLFSNCSLSYVNASRELIRDFVINYLAREKSDPQHNGHLKEQTSTTPTVPSSKEREARSRAPPSVPPASTKENQDLLPCDPIHSAGIGMVAPAEQLQPPTLSSDCYIFADPDYDLALSESVGDISVVKQFLDLLTHKLSLSEIQSCKPLPSSLSEAHSIQDVVHDSHPELNVHIKSADSATLDAVFQLRSPLLVHFCTHAYANLGLEVSPPSFWRDTETGLILAGFNTFRAQKFAYIDPKASTGLLTPLAVYGLNLTDTRLVFLSTCVSAVGTSTLLESTNSLANAFRVAGVSTVIATVWKIPDESTAQFVRHFYGKLLHPGVRPSEALQAARDELCKESQYSHLQNWAGFACYGDDIPLFPNSVATN